VLGAAAASPLLLATGCSSSESEAQTDSDDQLREDVAAQEAQLIAAYDATLVKYPALTDRLKPFRDQHAEHKQAMVPGESSTPTVTAPTIPATSSAAVNALRKAERSAASDRVSSCEKANAAELVRSLALIAASESQHSTSLAGGGS
jgi:hypothetical protein